MLTRLYLILLLSSAVTAMTTTLVAPALPAMAGYFAEYKSAEILAKFLLTIHPLCLGLFAPICGLLVDLWGREKTLLLSLLVFSLAGFLPYILNSPYIILFSRAVLGIGLGGITVSVTALIGDRFTGKELSQFSGYQAGVIAASSALFYVLGGLLAGISWRMPFLAYLLPLFLIPVMLRTKESVPIRKEKSIEQGESKVITHYLSLVLLYTFALVGMTFAFTYAVQSPFFLKQNGIGEEMIGVVNASMVIFSFVTAIKYKTVKEYLSFNQIFATYFVVSGAGLAIFSLATNWLGSIFASALFGLGFGLFLPNANVWLNSSVASKVRGRFASILTVSLLTGQLLSPILSEVIVIASSYQALFWYSGLAAIGLGVVILVLLWLTSNCKQYSR